MNATHQHNHPWVTPLALLQAVAPEEDDVFLLYSGLKTSYSGRYSWLGIRAIEHRSAQSFDAIDDLTNQPHHWLGWLSYELGETLEDVPSTAPANIPLPRLHFTRFKHLFRFDHEEKSILEYSTENIAFTLPDSPAPITNYSCPPVRNIRSNMSRERYLSTIEQTLEQILSGNFYQANITRKFTGDFASPPNSAALFATLCDASPAPYAAYIQLGETRILSSSPELFLRLDEENTLSTRPIKGTVGRGVHHGKGAEVLRNSDKDKAENLMIVDLMRNDFSRIAAPGSVEVDKLYDIDSFSTLHHMSSNITAKMQSESTLSDVLRATFPPGSMTGAPKISAMRWCATHEKQERGIYSGAIGIISPELSEFSVVIRTLVNQGKQFEFQVGGGIVADSSPENEWKETLIKARGIGRAIGLDEQRIAAL